MRLGDFPVRAQVPVADIDRAVEFYEGRLGLTALRRGSSAEITDGGRVYASGGDAALVVYQTTATGSQATVATWFVENLDDVVAQLIVNGVEMVRYEGLEHDAQGITERAGGGRIAWFQDPDGNTLALESDT